MSLPELLALIEPKKIAILILALLWLEWMSEWLISRLNQHAGPFVSGFLGGILSSTVVFWQLTQSSGLSLSSKIRTAIAALFAMSLQMALILLWSRPELFKVFLIPFILQFFSLGIWFFFFSNPSSSTRTQPQLPKLTLQARLIKVLKTALILFGFITVIRITQSFFNPEATTLIATIGGLFELHGITFALAHPKFTIEQATLALTFAFLSAHLSKILFLFREGIPTVSTLKSLFEVIATSFLAFFIGVLIKII